MNLVKKEQDLLNRKLTEYAGESCTLRVQLKRAEEKPSLSPGEGAASPRDEVIDSFCRVFRGQVVQGKQ